MLLCFCDFPLGWIFFNIKGEIMIKEIEDYAKKNNIPIMIKSGIDYLCDYIREHNIKRILEIGSAIGYSAIKMALVNDDVFVTTIEKDKERYDIALDNIKKFNLENRITLIFNDALTVEFDEKFDLIFIQVIIYIIYINIIIIIT